jgi:hypothetical protein
MVNLSAVLLMIEAKMMATFSSISHSHCTMNQKILYPNPPSQFQPPTPYTVIIIVHVIYQYMALSNVCDTS